MLWQVINQVIRKKKHKGLIISLLSIDGVKTYNSLTISQ